MKAIWDEIKEECCFIYHIPKYAVFGKIYIHDGYYYWSARVMDDCRIDHKPISGKARLLEKAKHIVEILCSDTDTLSRDNIAEENPPMELFALTNSTGQYMRAKGFSGGGRSWVDGIKTARIYTSVGPAKSQVTYWKKHFPDYDCPKIVVLEATIKEVLDQSERVSEAIKKQERDKISSKKTSIQNKIRSLTEELNQLMK